MEHRLIEEFETNSTNVKIFETDLIDELEGVSERLYVVLSTNKFKGTKYVRYGNKIQVDSIVKTYRGVEKRFKL